MLFSLFFFRLCLLGPAPFGRFVVLLSHVFQEKLDAVVHVDKYMVVDHLGLQRKVPQFGRRPRDKDLEVLVNVLGDVGTDWVNELGLQG